MKSLLDLPELFVSSLKAFKVDIDIMDLDGMFTNYLPNSLV
jgi:hypothetical protein